MSELRAIYDFDEGITQRANAKPLSIIGYENGARQDFIRNRINPFTLLFFLEMVVILLGIFPMIPKILTLLRLVLGFVLIF